MRAAARYAIAALLAALLASAQGAHAETLFVTDKIEIGIHEDKTLDSVIVAVVPSGTPLEIISLDGDFAQVRTRDGLTGWVDTRYVVTEKPDTALTNENDAKLKEATRALGDARAEAEVLRQRIKELERDAATAASQTQAAAVTDTGVAADENAEKLAEARRALAALDAENKKLKDSIAELEAAAREPTHAPEPTHAAAATYVVEPEPPPVTTRSASLGEIVTSWSLWQWLLLLSVLLLAFALGGYAVDWEIRRRHGGFRV